MRTVAAVLALIVCVHAGLWVLFRSQTNAPEFRGQLASLSYAPFASSDHPDRGARPTPEQIRADLKAIAPYTRSIRLYSSTGGAELVPPIAAEFGLKVAVGANIDRNNIENDLKDIDKDFNAWLAKGQFAIEHNKETKENRNAREVYSALELARHNSNVNAIYVGNEAVLRNDLKAEDLVKIIQR